MTNKYIITLFLILILVGFGMAQTSPSEKTREVLQTIEKYSPTSDIRPPVEVVTEGEYRKLQQTHKTYLLVAIIIATPIMLLIVLAFVRKSPHHSPENLVNVSALVLVIQSTTFISVYAPTSEQLTAPIGILGAIAGYLFGQYKKKEEAEAEVEPGKGTKPVKGQGHADHT